MSERILIRDRIITKIDAVKMEKGHFRIGNYRRLTQILIAPIKKRQTATS